MTEPLPDTWNDRDLPVLRTVVRLYDETLQVVRASTVVEETGLTKEEVVRAGVALGSAGLVAAQGRGGQKITMFGGVTAEARRIAGSWPTPESGVDRLIAALEHIAENTEDDEERTRAQQLVSFLKTSGKQVGLTIVSAVLTGQVT